MRFIAALALLCCSCQMAPAQEPLSFAAMSQRQPNYAAAAPVAPLDFGAMAERRPLMQAAPVPSLNFEAMRERTAPAMNISTLPPCIGPNCPTPAGSAVSAYQAEGVWRQGPLGKWRWKPN